MGIPDEESYFHRSHPPSRTATGWRRVGCLALLAAGALLLLVAVVVRLASDGDSELQPTEFGSNATTATATVATAGAFPQRVTWDESVMLEWCNTTPLTDTGFFATWAPGLPDGTSEYFDLHTKQNVTLDVREVCRQMVPLTPDPDGDMCASFSIANGKVYANYSEREVSTGGERCIIRIAPAEAKRRLAAQLRARDRSAKDD